MKKREELEKELAILRTAPLIPDGNYLSDEERAEIRKQFQIKSRPSMPSVRRSIGGLHLGDL